MDGSDMTWTFPVVVATGRTEARVFLNEDWDVVLAPLPGPAMLPPDADAQIVEALRRARATANQMGRNL